MIAVFTGSRHPGHYEELFTKLQALRDLRDTNLTPTIFVGDCPTGVDAIVREYAQDYGLPIAVFHAHWKVHGPKAGPIRNGVMIRTAWKLEEAGERVTVYYYASEDSRGTRDCVSRADQAGLDTVCLGGPVL